MLFTILGSHIRDNLVPLVHKLDTVATLRHEEIDNDELVGTCIVDKLLKFFAISGLDTLGLFPPV